MRNFWRRRGLRFPSLLELCTLAAVLLVGRAGAEEGYLQLRGALGVPSAFSRGGESIEEIARMAVAQKIDVLVMGDDYLLRVDYGMPFLRKLVHFGHERRSLVTAADLENYLDEIRRVDELFPELVLIDGIAATPFYFWNTDWGQRRLNLHGWDRRLVVVGLGKAEGYARLPVMGSAELEVWNWTGLLAAWPLLGLLYGWVARRRHPTGLRYGIVVISAVCLVGNFPFKVALWDAHSGRLGLAPHQHFIDSQSRTGGMVFWLPPGMEPVPEGMAGLDGRVEIIPRPSRRSGEIAHTYGYTGFAALRGGERIAVEAKGEWDRALGQFLRGERSGPVWGMGYVGPDGAEGQAEAARTIFLVRERSREGVLEAMRSGGMYAVRDGEERLVLDRFQVETEFELAEAGEEVLGRDRPRVSAQISSASGGEGAIRVELIRSGEVVARVSGKTPLELNHIGTAVRPGAKEYYRLLVNGGGGELVSNPIFVTGGEL
jgi:hypothetical protein